MISEQETSTAPILRVHLGSELTIYRAAELKQMLSAALETSDPQALEFDLSGVSEIDSAGIQLLIAAKKEAFSQQREMHLVGHSPAVIEAFELLKLVGYFGDPLIIPSQFSSGRSFSN